MIRKFFLSVFVVSILVTNAGFVFAQNTEPVDTTAPIEIIFFFSPTCRHCAAEEVFLAELQEQYPSVTVTHLTVLDRKNVELLKHFYEQYQVPEEVWGQVPVTILGDKAYIGFDDRIEQSITQQVEVLLGIRDDPNGADPGTDAAGDTTPVELPDSISVPFFGDLSLKNASPLFLSMALGGLDGFNACALAALTFLLVVLIATGQRKRVLWIGGTFIFVSGAVYYAFIAAWFNLFVALEQLRFFTLLIGIIVLASAVFVLRDYIHGIVCKLCNVTPGKKQGIFVRTEQKLMGKMEHLATSKAALPLVLLGVALVAAGVNMVELVCSFGIPLAYTKILSGSGIAGLAYYGYLLVYILFYMIDDFIIFLIALFTLRLTGLSEKYLKAATLISGLVLLLLGLLLIFKPDALTF